MSDAAPKRRASDMTISSSSSASAGPPGVGQIEVSIFGPGKGECIAVHAGAGDWLIVDSCIDQSTGRQPALDYLDALGVDIGSQVQVVLATHAHDDHIAGIGEVFERSESATLVLSAAATSEEFFASIEADADIEAILRTSIRAEYRRVLELAEQRAAARQDWSPIKRAVEGLDLWSRSATSAAPAAWVRSLSPSHHAISRSLKFLAEGTAQAGQRRRLAGSDPNEFAVAVWIQVGDSAVLLGADLLAGPAACGWQAVVATFTPPVKASYFKVPHHGAPNAHHEDVWTHLLLDEPIATLAPYRAGVTPRPSSQDIARLKALTPTLFGTANPRRLAPGRRVRRTGATLAQVAMNVRDPWGVSGQVRTRGASDGTGWTTELFAPALAL